MNELTTLLTESAELNAQLAAAEYGTAEYKTASDAVDAAADGLRPCIAALIKSASPEVLAETRAAAKVTAQNAKDARFAAGGAELDYRDGLDGATEGNWRALNATALMEEARNDAWDIIRGYRG